MWLGAGAGMVQVISNNVVWHDAHVSRVERASLFRQQPVTIWLTGLSGAGKSTLAFALEKRLLEEGHACYVLDGDNVRHGLNRDLGFSPADRKENIRRIAEVSRLFNDAGLIVISAFISPYRADRELARQSIGADFFVETWLSTPIGECERRDPKGLYSKARAGQIDNFTGISAPYEAPEAADLMVDTSVLSVERGVDHVIDHLRKNFRLGL